MTLTGIVYGCNLDTTINISTYFATMAYAYMGKSFEKRVSEIQLFGSLTRTPSLER